MKPNDIFANRYTLLTRIGMGGFSEVWKATDQMAEDTVVAVKIYAPERGMDQLGLKQFRREYAVVLNLNHPALLTARHFDVWEGRPYLVMPLIEGGSLQDRLAESGVLTEAELAGMLAGIADGLHYLHSNDILHQDIKPDNILIGPDNSYLLTDFGISGRLRSTLRKNTGSAKSMTVAYAPPERFDANPENLEASDVFSLGVLVYELATGNVPWMGNGGMSLKSGAEIPDLPGHFSKRFRSLVKSMMALNTGDRPDAKKVAKTAQEYLKTGHWPEIIQEASASGERKTQRIENTVEAVSPEASVITRKGKAAGSSTKTSKNKLIWLSAVLVLITVTAGGLWYNSHQQEAARLAAAEAELQAQEQALERLLQQAGESESTGNLNAAVSYYEEALVLDPENNNIQQLLQEVHDEIIESERQAEEQLQREREREAQRQRELEERRSRPDHTASPTNGVIRLASGFTPDPWTHSVTAGGEIDLESSGYYGFTTSPPVVNLEYTAGDFPLFIGAESDNDLIMLMYTPAGEWVFNDDYSGLNPGFYLENPQSGTYMIWAGVYEGPSSGAILSVSELEEDVTETVNDGPDVMASPIYDDITLESGFTPDPWTRSIVAGGSYDLSEIGYSGFISTAPDFDLYYTPGDYPLTIKVESDEDTILLINTPEGEWLFNDDYEGLNPGIVLDSPENGLYNIWIGSYDADTVDAVLIITEL